MRVHTSARQILFTGEHLGLTATSLFGSHPPVLTRSRDISVGLPVCHPTINNSPIAFLHHSPPSASHPPHHVQTRPISVLPSRPQSPHSGTCRPPSQGRETVHKGRTATTNYFLPGRVQGPVQPALAGPRQASRAASKVRCEETSVFRYRWSR